MILLLWSCAQVRPIPGGDKDTEPPLVVQSIPNNLSTHFTGNKFSITFDEYVSLNNIRQELVVSPPMEQPPMVTLKGKTVRVQWKEELQPNTTYSFNFGDGIVDIHEANPAEQLMYVFSTGDAIDSLSVRGQVLDAWTGLPVQGAKVMLYNDMSADHIISDRPVYFSKTNKEGKFNLPYLRDGSFQLVALDDKNSDYKLNSDESLAFVDSLVPAQIPDSLATTHLLRISQPLEKAPKLINYDVDSSGTFGLGWNRGFGDPMFRTIGNSVNLQWEFVPAKDSVVVYFAETPLDKIIPLEISWSGGVVDTLEIPFFSEALEGGSKLKFNVGKQHVAGQSVTITSSDWIIPSIDRVVLMEDSTKVDAYLDADEVRINHFNLRPALRSGKQYTLTVLPGAFVNLAGQPCDTSVVSFRTYEPDDLGKIILTLNHGEDPQHLVLELSGPEGVVARKTSLETGTILGLKDLVPGNYTARIFDDANGNDRWDPGDYEKKIQPERTWILPQTMNVRANWEVQVPWDF